MNPFVSAIKEFVFGDNCVPKDEKVVGLNGFFQYFRKPENYHYILSAIANGKYSVSEIGKYTGFAYNKCDNYLAGLIDCGIVKAEKVIYAPQTISKGSFRHTFDAIVKNGNMAVLVKVLENPCENCGRNELETLRDAVSIANTYYDSRVFIFSKGKFNDYAVAESSTDDVISLVGVEQLHRCF